VSFAALFGLAFGLAMDATAVAAARGASCSRLRARDVLLVALLFGGFQAFMPFLGWLVGKSLGPFVQAWDHWIAFLLLGGIGAKMLWDARSPEAAGEGAEAVAAERRDEGVFGVRVLLVLALATSIDALAAGITLPMLGAPLVLSLATIGLTTAGLSALGVVVGKKLGAALGSRLDVAGGLLLMGLGAYILFEHLSAG
jgi:manganese efflux pump family protein